MGDHEVELSAKFGLPEFHGFVVGAEGRYRGTWARRGKRAIELSSERAGLSVEELEARLQENEQLGDVFRRAFNRATEQSDEAYNDALARLVGAACDDALINEIDYIVAQVVRLEPLHLRVLMSGFIFADREVKMNTPEAQWVSPEVAVWAGSSRFSRRQVEKGLAVNPALAQSAIEVLVAAGFLQKYVPPELRVPGRNPQPTEPRFRTDDEWTPTALARAAIDYIFPNVAGTG